MLPLCLKFVVCGIHGMDFDGGFFALPLVIDLESAEEKAICIPALTRGPVRSAQSIRADDANLAVPLQRDASRLGLADRFSLEDVLDRHLDVSLANGPDGDRGGGSLGEGVGWQDIGSTQGGSSTVWQLRDVNWVS